MRTRAGSMDRSSVGIHVMADAHQSESAPVPPAVWPLAQPPTTLNAEIAPPWQDHMHEGELARRIVETYSQPGDLVVDPACGSGDLLAAAVRADRAAIGFHPDPDQIIPVRANLEQAAPAPASASDGWRIEHGDARRPWGLPCPADLIVFHPPPPDGEQAEQQGGPRAVGESAYARTAREVFVQAHRAARSPGGLLVVVTPPGRAEADCAVMAVRLVSAALVTGWSYLQHVIALTVPIITDHLQPPPVPPREDDSPAVRRHVGVHRDVLVFTTGSQTGGEDHEQ